MKGSLLYKPGNAAKRGIPPSSAASTIIRKSPSPTIHERLYHEHAVKQAQREQIARNPNEKEDKELRENCTFQPATNFNLSARHHSIGSEAEAMRRTPLEFARDMRLFEERRKMKIDQL